LLDLEIFATVSPDDATRRDLPTGGRRLHVRGTKVFLDGSLGARSAALLDPYCTMGEHRGYLALDPAALRASVARAAGAGLPSWIHAIGDAAVRSALDACETAPGLRHRIEHAQMIHPDDVVRFARLGVVASVQPIHMLEDAHWVHRLWGERSTRAFPLRALIDAGATLAFGSDTPVEAFDVLDGIRAALERTGRHGDALHPEQRLTVGESLRAFTSGAAYAAGCEDELGTVEAGRLASLVLLSHDIAHDAAHLEHCTVAATFVRGRLVHRRIPA
jgi:predicted amidohydrolase YtcJ